MPDIEFQEVIGRIEDTAKKQHLEREDGRLDADMDRLRRLMRQERERAQRLELRLRA